MDWCLLLLWFFFFLCLGCLVFFFLCFCCFFFFCPGFCRALDNHLEPVPFFVDETGSANGIDRFFAPEFDDLKFTLLAGRSVLAHVEHKSFERLSRTISDCNAASHSVD